MSKNKQAVRADRKHKNALKRKHKVRTLSGPRNTVEERLAARIKRAVHQPRTRQYKAIPVEILLAQGKERIKELRFIHYYLIFAKTLCDEGLIKGKLNYDIVRSTKIIKSVNESLLNIPKFDDETAIQVELYDLGEKMSTLSTEMIKFVDLLEPYHIYIDNTIMSVGKNLPEKEKGVPYEKWEIENEVLRMVAIDYIAKNVYGMKSTEGEAHE